jgi:TetR/AcrR family transcriptional repressor of nem operon
MARHRKTDPEKALEAAMRVFWKHGYTQVGTRQIEEETGITRFTLQTVYGGKLALFLLVLDHYLEIFESMGAPPVDVESLEDIATWFENRTNPPVFENEARNGCLLLNTLVEFGGGSVEVNDRAASYFSVVRGRFNLALNNLVTQGALSDGFDVQRHANILTSCAIGMNVVVRSAGDNTAGAWSAESSAAMIRDWR